MTAGKSGPYGNASIQGTGLSYRSKLNQNARQVINKNTNEKPSIENTDYVRIKLNIVLSDDGSIEIKDEVEKTLSKSQVNFVWSEKQAEIQEWLENQASIINENIDLIIRIHEDTPSPHSTPIYQRIPFLLNKPNKPKYSPSSKPKKLSVDKLSFFERLSKKRQLIHKNRIIDVEAIYKQALNIWINHESTVKKEYEKSIQKWEIELADWQRNKVIHEQNEAGLEILFPDQLKIDNVLMISSLEKEIQAIEWPRETLVNYEIIDSGKIFIDIDLPEIEDMPDKFASLAVSGKRLNIKKKSVAQLRKEYANHIHGIFFRLAGTVFYALPALENVIISGYSQRLDPATGLTNDDYLLSANIDRCTFSEINFESLEQVDPILAIEQFSLTRKMTKGGIFKPIIPITTM